MIDKFLEVLDVRLVLAAAVFFLVLEYRPPWWRKQQRKKCEIKGVRSVPGPVALPLIGTGWLLFLGTYPMSKLHEFHMDLHKKYGAIVKEEALMNVPVIHLFEKADIEKVLRCNVKYPLRPPVEAVSQYRRSRPDRYTTIGLVNEQGKAWQFLRSTLCPVLTSAKTVSSFIPQTEVIADDWCNLLKLLRNADGTICNLETAADRLSLEVTCAFVLGRRMGFLLPGGESENAKQLAEAVHQHFISTRDTYYGLPLWRLFPTPAYKRLMKSEEAIYTLAVELIQSADDSVKESPVFQAVLNADIDEKEKIAALVDFIAASINTMKNSFLFLLHSVASDVQIQQKILKDQNDAYLKACLTESFRMYPTAFCLARIIDTEMDLAGYQLEGGSVVVCHTGIACRNERNFHDPERFLPERWLNDDQAEAANNAQFLLAPFGAGRRICPGKRFIEQVIPVFVKYTVEQFEIIAQTPLETQCEFLLTPKGPISMLFKDRV